MSDSKTIAQAEVRQHLGELRDAVDSVDADVSETREWLASLDYVLKSKGPERVLFLLQQLRDKAAAEGVPSPDLGGGVPQRV